MKILLPVYSMADARLIVDYVNNYHWPADAVFKVIHVVGSVAGEAAFLQAEKDANTLLDDVIERLKAGHPRAEICSEVLSGDATLEIIAAASNWQAGMIVMGYRSRTDIQGVLAGSVSKGVVMQAPCSVAIIRPSIDADEMVPSRQRLVQEVTI